MLYWLRAWGDLTLVWLDQEFQILKEIRILWSYFMLNCKVCLFLTDRFQSISLIIIPLSIYKLILRVYLHIVLEWLENISFQWDTFIKVSYIKIVEETHFWWVSVSIIAAFVLKIGFYVIFHVFNIRFDDMWYKNILFIYRKVFFKCHPLLVYECLYLALLQIRQDSLKVVCYIEIKIFCLLLDQDY